MVVALLFSVPGAAAAEVKVGFVNVDKVLSQAPQAQAARKRIEAEFAPKDEELLKQQKEIRSLEDRLMRDGDVMAEAQRRKLEQDIRSMKRDFRRSQDEFREDLNLRRSQELSKLQRVVFKVIQDVARDEEYDLILHDGVAFAGARVDITESVITRLKAQYENKQ
ncbi:MAG: OmpH family outer membrane protein [Gammaproteobacteria bacterium]|nr:OmpH family outer membrane protein [Gammaproteobacteria bacterium]NIR84161.1 OmpH family outer membrane protein [Gammaproteobacteria bacterium]NIR89473.1 OmpH family outer membrane protein [Gammaproteobacteria bacterium]NIU05316.1 OmpH family outer membrane protein [Gammaproteobacteria bacterium]NIV52256.1 OmpH family outer membrane protein [Gammaproteobacteria bacterium]